ncbi:Undecaprenyl phosphate N,N'-diacetylbacillosamine 1-phosphate transferase [bacterium HR39]|nr:Undecaprenyl phosphate N,N'-diacetylbacillosamine 1-phosphate transferase [bacterium HR39]
MVGRSTREDVRAAMSVASPPASAGRLYVVTKRAFDAALAAALLLFTAPLVGVVALAVWATMGRPVLFVQERVGEGGRVFRLYKFRTMLDLRDERGELLPAERRLTRLGAFLRFTSLDELPQLWNILKGDMSFVGPRPLPVDYLPYYTPEQMRRHEVTPGLTGWAQIHGRNRLSWEETFRLDVWYVDHRCWKLDLAILARTVVSVLKGEGVSPDGGVVRPPYRGPQGAGVAAVRGTAEAARPRESAP